MSLSSIRTALETALIGVVPSIETAWENKPYTPKAGTAYQQVFFMPAEPREPELGNHFRIEQGLLQVTLNYPLRAGPAAAMARAELLRATFYRGASFSSGGIVVVIEGTPWVGVARPDEFYELPVTIRWYANIST